MLIIACKVAAFCVDISVLEDEKTTYVNVNECRYACGDNNNRGDDSEEKEQIVQH